MCDAGPSASPVTLVPADVNWSGQRIPLDLVDEVQVLTVCDNSVDIFLIDQFPHQFIPNSVGTTFHLAADVTPATS